MENASKALLMAGGVLIALLIIGALVLMFSNLSNYQQVGQVTDKEAQVVEFNNQYETYHRKNVRGSDLYSLLNRVVDYNRRKSTEGTGVNDEGQYLAYEPMTIKISFVALNGKGGKELFSVDSGSNGNLLLVNNEYEQSGISNQFEKQIVSKIEKIEERYGKESLTNLTTGLTKIFINRNGE